MHMMSFSGLKLCMAFEILITETLHAERSGTPPKALFFLILGLRIFFSQNIKVGGGKKMKIKITKKIFLV